MERRGKLKSLCIMKKKAFCTISSHNYMAYGLTCLLSVKQFNPDCDLFYLIADSYNEDYYTEYFDQITFVDLKNIGFEKDVLENMEFKYNVVEFNTAVKPKFYMYLFELGYETVVYLDPDIECYYSFERLFDMSEKYSIIITPHKITVDESELIDDSAFLNNGIYNLGFIALNKSEETDNFLNWWNAKLRNQCFIDYASGLATDQIWVELATTLFQNMLVIKDSGLNVAFWNFHERNFHIQDNTYYTKDGPLIFFHFSSLSIDGRKDFIDYITEYCPDFLEFYVKHIENVKQNGHEFFAKIEYAYSKFDNGSIINREIRWLYGFSEKLQKMFKHPFETQKDSFYYFYRHRSCLKYLNNPENRTDKIIKFFIKIVGIKFFVSKVNSIFFVKRVSQLFDRDEIC